MDRRFSPPELILDDQMRFTDELSYQMVNEVLAAVQANLRIETPMSQILLRFMRLAGELPLERWMFQLLVQAAVRRLEDDIRQVPLCSD